MIYYIMHVSRANHVYSTNFPIQYYNMERHYDNLVYCLLHIGLVHCLHIAYQIPNHEYTDAPYANAIKRPHRNLPKATYHSIALPKKKGKSNRATSPKK